MSIKSEYFKYLDHFGKTLPLREFAENPELQDVVALRHDVDYDIDAALEMAFWEKEHGIRSTYFLLHTSDYWDDPILVQKALQIQDFGHEVGLHLNFLTLWRKGNINDIETAMAAEIDRLRQCGIDLVGVSPHGDKACYEYQFINYWCFSELRPEDPVSSENGHNAEGIPEADQLKRISYPAEHMIARNDGLIFPLWTISMQKNGILYDAIHINQDKYFTDSGGKWKRSENPLQCDIFPGRCQVLMHPLYWLDFSKKYFFLSTARSGSKWLANLLDKATSVRANHEFLLNVRVNEKGEFVKEKHTGFGFAQLVRESGKIIELMVDGRMWIDNLKQDYAEVNVYLAHMLFHIETVFPDAVLLHLYRNPCKVVRSLLNRDWYDTPGDTRHPDIKVPQWQQLSQFEKVCWYVRKTNESLLLTCRKGLALEAIASDEKIFASELKSLGIAWYPRLGKELFGKIVNANKKTSFPEFPIWPDKQKRIYGEILKPLSIEMGYSQADGRSETFWHGMSRKFLKENEAASKATIISQATQQEIVLYDIDLVNSTKHPVKSVNCNVKKQPNGIFIRPKQKNHGYMLIGTSKWKRKKRNEGWTINYGRIVSGEIEVDIRGEGIVQLFALMYSKDRRLATQRKIAQPEISKTTTIFSFRPDYRLSSYGFALFFNKDAFTGSAIVKHFKLKESF